MSPWTDPPFDLVAFLQAVQTRTGPDDLEYWRDYTRFLGNPERIPAEQHPLVVDGLLHISHSLRPEHRSDAVECLVLLWPLLSRSLRGRALRRILELMGDPDRGVRGHAQRPLPAHDMVERQVVVLVNRLLDLTHHEDAAIRLEAATMLNFWTGAAPKKMAPAIAAKGLELTRDMAAQVRRNGLDLLLGALRKGADLPAARQRCIELLLDPEPFVRRDALMKCALSVSQMTDDERTVAAHRSLDVAPMLDGRDFELAETAARLWPFLPNEDVGPILDLLVAPARDDPSWLDLALRVVSLMRGRFGPAHMDRVVDILELGMTDRRWFRDGRSSAGRQWAAIALVEALGDRIPQPRIHEIALILLRLLEHDARMAREAAILLSSLRKRLPPEDCAAARRIIESSTNRLRILWYE